MRNYFRILFLCISTVSYFIVNGQGNSFYGIGSGGKYNTGVIFKINEADCSSEVLKDFDRLPLSGFLDNLVNIEDQKYGIASYGGDRNYGGIFKLNTADTTLQELYNFSDSLEYRPIHFFKYGNSLLLISVNYDFRQNVKDCSNKCISYLFSVYNIDGHNTTLKKQFSKNYYNSFFKFDLVDSNKLIFQNEETIWQLDLEEFTFNKLLNFNPIERIDFLKESYELKNYAISYFSNDTILHGFFNRYYNSKGDKKQKLYSYKFNVKTKRFSFEELNDKNKRINSVHNDYRNQTTINYLQTYFKGKLLFHVYSNDNYKGNYFLSKKTLSNYSKIKAPKYFIPEINILNDSNIYSIGLYKKASQKSIGFLNFHISEKRFEKVQLLTKISTLDILFSKVEKQLLYLVSDSKINIVNLNNYSELSYKFKIKDDLIIDPVLDLYHGGQNFLYGVTKSRNIFKLNTITKKFEILSNLNFHTHKGIHYFKVDSCNLTFSEYFRSGNFLQYNQCNGELMFIDYSRDSIPAKYQKTIFKSVSKKHPLHITLGHKSYNTKHLIDLKKFYTITIGKRRLYVKVHDWSTDKINILLDTTLQHSNLNYNPLYNIRRELIGLEIDTSILMFNGDKVNFYQLKENLGDYNSYLRPRSTIFYKDKLFRINEPLYDSFKTLISYDLKTKSKKTCILNPIHKYFGNTGNLIPIE